MSYNIMTKKKKTNFKTWANFKPYGAENADC